MVHYHINWSCRFLKVVTPYLKSFENGKQFFVMDIIVEFGGCKGVGMESNRVDFIVHWGYHGENGSKGVVQCVHFNYEQRAWNPVHQYWCGGKGFSQHVESGVAFVGEIPSRAFVGEAGEWNNNVRVVWNEMPVEISKTRKDCISLIFWGSGQS